MFHITITQDGETKLDLDTKAIIGAFDQDEETTTGFALIDKASATELAAVIDTAEQEIKTILEECPSVVTLRLMAKLKEVTEANAKPEETEK